MRIVRRRSGWLLLVLAALAGPACTRWEARQTPQPSGSFLGERVRVTRTDNRTVVLANAGIAADSVVGWGTAEPVMRQRIAIPLGEVRAVETRRADPGKTVVAAVAAGLVVGVAAIQVLIASALR